MSEIESKLSGMIQGQEAEARGALPDDLVELWGEMCEESRLAALVVAIDLARLQDAADDHRDLPAD
jgi:hypothetical protein